MKVRPVCLEADDAIELGELLEFLYHWLGSDDSLGPALDRFVGSGYNAEELQADLLRFARLVDDLDTRAAGGGR